MENKSKRFLVYGNASFADMDAVRKILQERVKKGNTIYTFRQDGTCHITEIWARSCHISCYALPLPDSIPKRQACILEIMSLGDEVILFGSGTEIETNYIFRLAKLAKRTIYCIGFTGLPELKQ